MGIQHRQVPHDWNYFFCLEEDIIALSRWIEFSFENEGVYSIELARLLMTASAEVDVVAKSLCNRINPDAKASSINAYQAVLLVAYPDLPNATVFIPRFGKELRPWSNWQKEKSTPHWWTANNKVKHHREEHFKLANLKNVLNSIAALFVLLLLRTAKDRESIYPGPTVFEPGSYAYRDGVGIVFNR